MHGYANIAKASFFDGTFMPIWMYFSHSGFTIPCTVISVLLVFETVAENNGK